MKKKLFLALITVILGIFAVGITTSAETYEILTYEISNGKVTITDCKTSASGSLTIPSKIDGYPVTSIGDDAFYGCDSLSTITIPDSVTSIGDWAFFYCTSLSTITIPDSVTSIGYYTFSYCDSLSSITIPDNVTSIGYYAFDGCKSLSSIAVDGDNQYYSSLNGNLYNKDQTTLIQYAIGKSATSFSIPDSVTFIGDSAFYRCESLSTITIPDSVASIGDSAFYRCESLTDVYYTGTKEAWNNISIDSGNAHLINATIHYNAKQFTYKFIDSDGNILKNKTANEGTTITPPSTPADKDPYTFDYWQGYTEGMALTEDITFTAVYKYKSYSIFAGGISVTAVYGSDFDLPTQAKDGYNFIGYYTEKNGKGTQITDELGNSLKPYDTIGDLTIYPHYESIYLNKLVLSGDSYGNLGDTVSAKFTFATDKEAQYLTMTVKYPAYLTHKGMKVIDFAEVYEDSVYESDGYNYVDFTCLYDYDGNTIPAYENITPFELKFEISENAPAGIAEITAENIMLIGNEISYIGDVIPYSFEIKPKLAERIEIIGSSSIDAPTQFTANVFPDYATNKAVAWSVSDTSVATISDDGVLTPIKNGTVTITATAQDGSGVSASKTITVEAYAKLTSLDFGDGICLAEFDENIRDYTVYVKADATAIILTPTFSGGVLRPNGSGIWISGKAKEFALNSGEPTVITLHRQNVQNMTNSIYTITIVPLDSTKTVVSEDGMSFDVLCPYAEAGDAVIISLFDGDRFIEAQTKTYTGGVVNFSTDKAYTTAKVMVWDGLATAKPVCKYETIQ